MIHLFKKYEGHQLWFEMVQYAKSKVLPNEKCFSDLDVVCRCFQVMRVMPDFNQWLAKGMEHHKVRTVREFVKKFLDSTLEANIHV